MKVNKASKTAQYMALFRALETSRKATDRLFTDPYSISFLDGGLKLLVKVSKISFSRKLVSTDWYQPYA